MRADSIRRIPAAEGRGEVIESRGRLIADKDREVGSFIQRIELVAGLPLALIDIEARGFEPPRGPLFEQHLACRFAWNENEDVALHRSLHTQSIATERGRFTAPWFIELSSPDDRDGRVAILTGGLPWHMRSSPHLLDSILPFQPPIEAPNQPPTTSAGRLVHRLAVGVGLKRPWDLATALLAESPTASFRTVSAEPAVADNVRLTVGPVRQEEGRVVAARIGLLESAGRAGEVRLECAAEVARAVPCDAAGRQLSDRVDHASAVDGVTIDGRSITLDLKRYQWRHLDLEFHR